MSIITSANKLYVYAIAPLKKLIRKGRDIQQFFLNYQHYFKEILRPIWKKKPHYLLLFLVLNLIQPILAVIAIYLTKIIINDFTKIAILKQEFDISFNTIIISIIYLLIIVLNSPLSALIMWFQSYYSEAIKETTIKQIHDKTTSLELMYFEKQEYYDIVYQASKDSLFRPTSIINTSAVLINRLLTLLSLMFLLLSLAPWLLLVITLSAIPLIWINSAQSRKYVSLLTELSSPKRLLEYYHRILTEREAAVEIRSFRLVTFFRERHNSLMEDLRDKQLRIWLKQLQVNIITAVIEWLVLISVLAWMGVSFIANRLTIGDIYILYQVFRQIQQGANDIIRYSNILYIDLMMLRNLFALFEMLPSTKSKLKTHLPALENKIEIRGVSFKYPNSPRPIFDSLSLIIPAKKVVAIIGDNGAGKTTLIKLLCRFFEPTKGEILWDKQPLADFDPSSIWQQIALMPQHPYQFNDTLYNNIVIGNLNRMGSDVTPEMKIAGVDQIIEHLAQAEHTFLGKQFGGTDLSGGQWQRIALARTLLAQRNFYILDEPTSAMDKWMEQDWLTHLNAIRQDKTIIIITHRFTTARAADHIFVFRDGKVIEEGSHEDLLVQKGYYAKAWSNQIKN